MKQIIQQMSDGTFRRKQKDAIGLKEFSQWQKSLTSTANQLQKEIGTKELNSIYGKYIMETTNSIIKGDVNSAKKSLTSGIHALSKKPNPSAKKLVREFLKMHRLLSDGTMRIKQKDVSPGFKQKRKVGDAPAANLKSKINKIYRELVAIGKEAYNSGDMETARALDKVSSLLARI